MIGHARMIAGKIWILQNDVTECYGGFEALRAVEHQEIDLLGGIARIPVDILGHVAMAEVPAFVVPIGGIAVVTAGYRLSPGAKSPAYIEDAAAAVAWTFNQVEKYGGSSKRIFVSGHSAGGYLTMMVGLDEHWLAACGVDANGIAGLVPFSGQAITHFTVRAERGIPDKQPVIDNLAPLFHVRKDAPPLLLITGDRETEMLGRYEENAYLWRMMKEVGNTHTELVELPGYNHNTMPGPAYPLLLKFIGKNGSQ